MSSPKSWCVIDIDEESTEESTEESITVTNPSTIDIPETEIEIELTTMNQSFESDILLDDIENSSLYVTSWENLTVWYPQEHPLFIQYIYNKYSGHRHSIHHIFNENTKETRKLRNNFLREHVPVYWFCSIIPSLCSNCFCPKQIKNI